MMTKEASFYRECLRDSPSWALSLMSRGIFHPDVLISRKCGLDETGKAFQLLEEKPDRYLKVLIRVIWRGCWGKS